MGLRTILVVCTTSFFLGTLTTHWIADSLTLWQSPLTNEHLRIAATYYATLSTLPNFMQYILIGAVVMGLVTILSNFLDWRGSNLFDWASLFLFSFSVFIYVYSVIPNITRLSTPLPPAADPREPTFPNNLREPTLELASSHLVCSVALTGVLLLQGGRWWADGEDETWDEGAKAKRRAQKRAETDVDPAVREGSSPLGPGGKRKARRKRSLLRGLNT